MRPVLLCALVLHHLLGRRRGLSFRQSWLYCTAGYATHAVLDACTTYGTMLLWPFSDARFAWNTISIIDRGGISRDLPSRVEHGAELRGTKHRVASEREVLVAIGRSDGRTLAFVPEVKGGETTGITLLHLAFHERLPADVMRGVLQGYDRRYDRLVDWVTETEGSFDELLLGELPVAELLIQPISDTADHWRR